jgi:hypothetical protein
MPVPKMLQYLKYIAHSPIYLLIYSIYLWMRVCQDAERAYILIRARCIHEASGKTKESSMRTASRSLESGCTDNGGDDCEVFARVVEWMIGSLSRDLVIELTDFLLGCLPCGCDAL